MILITGSIGNTGIPLLRILVEAGAKIRALIRDPAKESEQVRFMMTRGRFGRYRDGLVTDTRPPRSRILSVDGELAASERNGLVTAR